MIVITPDVLKAVYDNIRVIYARTLDETQVLWQRVAMLVPSTTSQEIYGWLKSLPGMREWIGDRVIKSLEATGYTIVNKTWENTIGVKREDIQDEQLGIYSSAVAELARAAKTHPDELIFGLLKAGFAATCHDGQPYFDDDHPLDPSDTSKGTWSNLTAGSETPWYLLDVSRALKPLIFQKRQDIDLVAMDNPNDQNVFMRREFVYGVDARHNVGFGLPQLAHGAKVDLTPANLAAVKAAMRSLKNEEERPLNILGQGKPLLVVPPSLEDKANKLANAETILVGGEPETNSHKGTIEVLTVNWLA